MNPTMHKAALADVKRPAVGSVVAVVALGGLMFGYDTAVVSGAVGAIDANFVVPRGLSRTAADTLSGFVVSSALVGCVIGAAVAGWLAGRLGRRRALIVAALLFMLSALGAAWPEFALGRVGGMGAAAALPFAIYRILGGIGVGIASMVSPLYIAEIAPAGRRGHFVAWQQIAIMVGILVVYCINWMIARAGDEAWLLSTGWRLMFASGTIPASLFLVLLSQVPESPRWLVQQGRIAAAAAVLARLRIDRAGLLDEIQRSLVVPHEPVLSFGPALVAVGILLSMFQQFIGINVVLYYAPVIFSDVGASTDTALLQTIFVGMTNLVFTLVAMATVDRWGRKPLMIGGGLVMGVSMLALGTLFYLRLLGVGALVAMLVYIAAFAVSWGPVTWILLAEIFPNTIRDRAMALAVSAQWISNLAVTASFKVLNGDPGLTRHFHHGVAYWLYAAMGFVAAAFVWRMVPETRGRRLEEMASLWRSRAA